jgi:prepilin peptidase CpaA
MNADLRWLAPAALYLLLLALAVRSDVRTRRIPNRLVASGMLAGALLQTALPAGAGLFSDAFGSLGLAAAAEGFGLGLLMLLPMYALGVMGAGDVKLLAMAGVFLGPQEIVRTALATMLAGGVLALAAACWQGMLRQVLNNLRVMAWNSCLRAFAGSDARVIAPPTPTGKLPYAVAIGAGALINLLMIRLHY